MARRHRDSVWLLVLAVFVFILFVLAIVWGVLTGEKSDEVIGKSSLPVMKITLADADLAEVHTNGKDVKYDGSAIEIIDNGATTYYDGVELKGRGNYSWVMDKKSYQIKFDKKVDLFGMGKKRKWALVGNGIDDSLMRNDLAYFMSDVLGGDYKMEGRFVELVINDEDLGVYYLLKTTEIDKQAVDLREPGGALVEMDNVYCRAEQYYRVAENGDCLVLKDTVVKGDEVEVMEDFLGQYNDFLTAIDERDFEKINGVADVESFARYFVFSEFVADPDAYVTSWYLYKDGFEDKIRAGLVWDFDAAFGNRSWGDWPEEFYEPTVLMSRFEYTFEKEEGGERVCRYDKEKTTLEAINISWVMCDLLEVPEFRELAQEFYVDDFRNKKDKMIGHIWDTAREIGSFAKKDAEMWKKGRFDEEILYLADWVSRRFELFDEVFVGGLSSGTAF